MKQKLYVIISIAAAISVFFPTITRALESNIEIEVGNRFAIGKDVVVEPNERVDDVVVIGGDIAVMGEVTGDATVIGGNLTVTSGGKIDGDAVVIGGSVTERPGGEILGSKTIVFGKRGIKGLAGLAALAGAESMIVGTMAMAHIFTSIVRYLVLLLLGIALVVFFDKPVERAASVTRKKPGMCILAGLGAGVLFIPLIALLTMSIVGIPLIPLMVIIYAAGCVFGTTAVALAAGEKLSSKFSSIKTVPWKFIAGATFLWLLTIIPVLGIFVSSVVATMALGGAALSRMGTRET